MSDAEELFAQYRPVAKRIAQGFMRKLPRNVLYEDLEAAAFLGLWQAVNADRNREGFEWYLRVRVRGAVIDELRTQDWLPRRARSRAQSKDTVAPSVVRLDELSFGDQALLVSWDTPPDERLDAIAQIRERAAAFERLPDRLKIIIQRVASGAKQREIGVELGISEPRVSQLQARAVALLLQASPERIRRPRPSTLPPPNPHCVKDDFRVLGAVWECLCQGSWRIGRLYATEYVFGIEIRRNQGTPLAGRDRLVLERWLTTGHAKAIGAEFQVSRASLSRLLTDALAQIGVACMTKRVPLIIPLLSQAPRVQASIEHLASPCLIEFTRQPRLLEGLTRAEGEIARHLLDGADTTELSFLRATAPRTIGRQTHDIFTRFQVSGVNELRSVVARSLLALAESPLPGPQ
jgi:RNA polymerase sigma factor for flagellar operon FliA